MNPFHEHQKNEIHFLNKFSRKRVKHYYLLNDLWNFGAEEKRFLKPFFLRCTGEVEPGVSRNRMVEYDFLSKA